MLVSERSEYRSPPLPPPPPPPPPRPVAVNQSFNHRSTPFPHNIFRSSRVRNTVVGHAGAIAAVGSFVVSCKSPRHDVTTSSRRPRAVSIGIHSVARQLVWLALGAQRATPLDPATLRVGNSGGGGREPARGTSADTLPIRQRQEQVQSARLLAAAVNASEEQGHRKLVAVSETSTFEDGWDDWTLLGNSDFERMSGSTPSSYTGPSSAYAGSYYVYCEASNNYPGFGFIMQRDLGDNVALSVSFHYHMYGSTMGTVWLQGSNDGGSTYTNMWSKSGNLGNSWQGADVSVGTAGTQWLRFVYLSGSGYYGDFALDEVEVVVNAPSLQPTLSPAPTTSAVPTTSQRPTVVPTISQRPTVVPSISLEPTPISPPPTNQYVEVSTFAALSSAIASDRHINVVGNITFSTEIEIISKTNVRISSDVGAVLNGGGRNRLFFLSGGASVTIAGLQLSNGNGNGKESEKNGGLVYMRESSLTVENSKLLNGTSQNHGGLVYVDDSSLTVKNSTLLNGRVVGTSSTAYGGCVHVKKTVYGSSLTIINSEVVRCTSPRSACDSVRFCVVWVQNFSRANPHACPLSDKRTVQNPRTHQPVIPSPPAPPLTPVVQKGGAVYAALSAVDVFNSSFSHNVAGMVC